MRSDSGPVRVLSPRAPHAIAAALRAFELSVSEIVVPALETEAPQARTIDSLPVYLLVRRPSRRDR